MAVYTRINKNDLSLIEKSFKIGKILHKRINGEIDSSIEDVF